ncbi:hypothetical protein MMC19_002070 [Ptychographa xylographoides]|nr:hypothetical protein [Ptychographa xylographoides]
MDDFYLPSEVMSFRSRASSIISTGTKTSIGTLAQPHMLPFSHEDPQSAGIDVVLGGGRRNFRITARPGSILSISSYDHPAPPYDARLSTTLSTTTASAPSVQEVDTAPSPHVAASYPSRSSRPIAPIVHPSLTFPLADSSPCPPHLSRSPHVPESPGSDSRTDSPPLSPTLPSPPTLSQHYTDVVRTIDANHRSELANVSSAHVAELARLTAAHIAALASTRHSIDAAYRVALRARDTEVERTRQECAIDVELARQDAGTEIARVAESHKLELAYLEDKTTSEKQLWMAKAMELRQKMQEVENLWISKVEKARNEVEDLWEGRWRDRMAVEGEERCRLRDRVRIEEGDRWVAELGRAWPEMKGAWEEVKEAIVGRGKGLEGGGVSI